MPASRAPNCPALSLTDAIERVENIYQAEGRSDFNGARAVDLMGYNGLNGASRRALGAVRAFGLVVGRGANLHISDDAVLIIADSDAHDQGDRNAALLRALCNNRVFADLQERFGFRASLNDLAAFLQKRYGFKPGAARKTSQIYRNSAAMVLNNRVADSSSEEDRVSSLPGGRASVSGTDAAQFTGSGPDQNDVLTGTRTAAAETRPNEADKVATVLQDTGRSAVTQQASDGSGGVRRDTFSLGSGSVELAWTGNLTAEQLEDLTDWLILEHRKIVRESSDGSGPRLERKRD